MKPIDEVSGEVIAEATQIHRALGPGLLESAYEIVLTEAMLDRGYDVRRQVPVDISYRHLRISGAFRVDLLVDNRLIVELKCVERLLPVHAKQLLTYLRLMKQPVGLLLNFSGETMKEGIRRLVNNHYPAENPSAPSARNESDWS